MSQVRKGNRILTIEPHKVDDYIARGYDHIDEDSGEVIKKGDPVSLVDFKREYSSLKAQVKEKDARIVELEAQNAELTTKVEELEAQNAELTTKVEELEAGAKTPAKASKAKKDTVEE